MTRERVTGAAVAVLFAIVAGSMGACGDKKDPLVPDNPSSDPLMMDGGGGGAVDPSPAGSSAPK